MLIVMSMRNASMGTFYQAALLMRIVNMDSIASKMNARNHARVTKLVLQVIMAHTVTLITKFAMVHAQKMQIVLEDTHALKKDVWSIVVCLNIAIMVNIVIGLLTF